MVCPVLLCHTPSENIYLSCGQQMFKYQDTSHTALLSITQLAMVNKQYHVSFCPPSNPTCWNDQRLLGNAPGKHSSAFRLLD